MLDFSGILQPAHLQRQKLRLGDLGDHPGQLFLDKLMRCDWLVTELLTQLGILQSSVIAGHSCPNRPKTNTEAGLVQAHQGRFQAVGFRQDILGGNVNILKRQPRCDRSP